MNVILPVDGKVYASRNVQKGTFYQKCVSEDLISKIDGPLKQMGFHLSFDGIYTKQFSSVGVHTPWNHVNHLHTKRCAIDHGLKFDVLGYIPPKCQECWKVVVGPRTLKELFALLEVEKGINEASKCGIELRYYTPRWYGGYFYTNSLEEGRERYEQVRKAVDEHISSDVPIILKRACTEYELCQGPSPAWHMTSAQWKMEEELEALVDQIVPIQKGQTKFVEHMIFSNWIEWAWKNQDPTVSEYIGDLPLYPPAVQYHEGDIEVIKLDILKARAMAKNNIEPENVEAVYAAIGGLKLTKGIRPKQVGELMGLDNINPMFIGEGIELG